MQRMYKRNSSCPCLVPFRDQYSHYTPPNCDIPLYRKHLSLSYTLARLKDWIASPLGKWVGISLLLILLSIQSIYEPPLVRLF